jgi:hypothetical protein
MGYWLSPDPPRADGRSSGRGIQSKLPREVLSCLDHKLLIWTVAVHRYYGLVFRHPKPFPLNLKGYFDDIMALELTLLMLMPILRDQFMCSWCTFSCFTYIQMSLAEQCRSTAQVITSGITGRTTVSFFLSVLFGLLSGETNEYNVRLLTSSNAFCTSSGIRSVVMVVC